MFTHRVGSSALQMSTWSYRYDGLKRLNTADHYPGTSGTMFLIDTERDIAYDRNGITALKRYGSSGLVNDLSFTHTGNRMTSLIDANATGNDAGTKAFTYDANGNMTSDGRKGLEMSWNLLNLADSAAMHGSSLTYAYLSDGSKVGSKADDGNGAARERRYIGASAGVSVAAEGATTFATGAITSGIGTMLMANSAKNKDGGYDRGSSSGSSNQMKQSIEKGKAPDSIVDAHMGKFDHEQTHVHFKDGSALNKDGSWKHKTNKGTEHMLTNKEIDFLKGYGWELPR